MVDTRIRLDLLPVLGPVNDASAFAGHRTGVGKFLAPAVKAYMTAAVTLDVRHYGAKGDGVADDTDAFVAALAAAGGGHTEVRIPAGTFRLRTGVLAWAANDRLTIQGSGPSTFLQQISTSGNLFSGTAGYVTVRDLTVLHPTPGAVTSGAFFSFINCTARLDGIDAYFGSSLVKFGLGCGNYGAHNILAVGQKNDVIAVDVSTASVVSGLGSFSNLKLQGLTDSVGAGLKLVSSDSIVVSDCNIAGHANPILAQTVAGGGYLGNLFFSNILCDGFGGSGSNPSSGAASIGWLFDGTAAFLGRVYLNNCWGCTMGKHGLYAKNVKTLSVADSIFIDNGGDGLLFDAGCHNVSLSGNTASANSLVIANSVGCHIIGGNAYRIIGNKFGPTYNLNDLTTIQNTQNYGVVIVASVTHYHLMMNDLTGNVTGGFGDGGGGTINITKFVSSNTTGAAVT